MRTKTYIVSFPHTLTSYHRSCYDHQQEYGSSHDLEKSVMTITDWKKGTSYLTFYTPWFFYPTITKKRFEFPVKLSGACFTRNKVTPQLHNWTEAKTTSLTPSLRVPCRPRRGRT